MFLVVIGVILDFAWLLVCSSSSKALVIGGSLLDLLL